jgi:hypothetical protein
MVDHDLTVPALQAVVDHRDLLVRLVIPESGDVAATHLDEYVRTFRHGSSLPHGNVLGTYTVAMGVNATIDLRNVVLTAADLDSAGALLGRLHDLEAEFGWTFENIEVRLDQDKWSTHGAKAWIRRRRGSSRQHNPLRLVQIRGQ